jgi:hypothetical protein
MLGILLWQFNSSLLTWGLCLSSSIKIFFGCLDLMYAVYVWIGEVWVLRFVACCLCQLSEFLLFLSLIFVCQHGVWSALNLWALIGVLFIEEYVREQMAEEIRWEGVSQAVVKIVMNLRVLQKTSTWISSWATVSFLGRTVLHNIDCHSLYWFWQL